MTDAELELLKDAVRGAKSYIEIGTLWGGSAITAALSNPELQVTCIDPFTGYYGEEFDPFSNEAVTVDKFWENCEHAGVKDRITLIQKSSVPFPAEGQYDIGLVDGNHTIEYLTKDMLNLSRCCKNVLIHDIDREDLFGVVNQYKKIIARTERLGMIKGDL